MLSASDIFLVGLPKKLKLPHTSMELKARLRLEIERIPLSLLHKVMNNLRTPLQECLDQGHHLNDVILKK